MKPIDILHYMKLNKITSKDVAQKTGYSTSTISMYLNSKKEMPQMFIDIFKKVYSLE